MGRTPALTVAAAPKRIQLSRRAGWRKPPGALVVSRPSRWGNPFVVTPSRSRAEAVHLYEEALRAGELSFTIDDVRRELSGRALACWCPLDGPCHADVLLAAANRSTPDE
jgi:hypothetical protein